jgi:transcriptional regulator with XRE-family HTH domain
MEKFHYGQNLKKIREAKGIKQYTIAQQLNISQTSYSRMEADPEPPYKHIVAESAKALNLLPTDLASNFEQLQTQPILTVRGFGIGHRAIMLFKSKIGLIIVLSISVPILDAIYKIAKSFCEEMGASYRTMLVVSYAVVFLTIGLIVYVVKKIQRSLV